MPLYEYRCEQCGRRFEVLQRVGDGPAGLVCPRCGGDTVTRQVSSFATAGSIQGCAPRGRFT